ncbi:hypothetical protein E2C01_093635 [Portunus trituberculatus]|uniref:Uncharacterized protein n=1 Tax=Portunus trituberculatus TaxID=210409 RepID=A0A5B7JUY7_PORTR|nr:hypothetical protein [Portunus trituberculatus]
MHSTLHSPATLLSAPANPPPPTYTDVPPASPSAPAHFPALPPPAVHKAPRQPVLARPHAILRPSTSQSTATALKFHGRDILHY